MLTQGDPILRARALWLLGGIPGQGDREVQKAIKDSDPNFRVLAIRILRLNGTDIVSATRPLIQDPSPQVRREIALAFQHLKPEEALEPLLELCKQYDGKDRWYLEALGLGADNQWDPFLDVWLQDSPDAWNSPAGRRIVWRSRAKKTPGLLVKIVSDKGTSADERQEFMHAFDFLQGPDKDAALMELVTGSLK